MAYTYEELIEIQRKANTRCNIVTFELFKKYVKPYVLSQIVNFMERNPKKICVFSIAPSSCIDPNYIFMQNTMRYGEGGNYFSLPLIKVPKK